MARCSLSQLKEKEVINVCDGRRLGCVEDIEFCGIPCRFAGAKMLESRSWVMVTAKISAEKHRLYKGDVGPVLTAIEVTQGAVPAEPDVCTF